MNIISTLNYSCKALFITFEDTYLFVNANIGRWEVRKLAENYTKNQTASIAIQWGTALWALTSMAAALLYLPTIFTGAGIFWVILGILSWIWVPLMVMRVRIVFLISLIQWIVLYVGHIALLASVGALAAGWWNFGIPWLHLSYLVAWLAGLAAIYFNYKSYMELKK